MHVENDAIEELHFNFPINMLFYLSPPYAREDILCHYFIMVLLMISVR